MKVQAKCRCGAELTVSPQSPAELGNGHGYAANNNETVDAERRAVADAFEGWVGAHARCCTVTATPFPDPGI